jgi:hypothetical protein
MNDPSLEWFSQFNHHGVKRNTHCDLAVIPGSRQQARPGMTNASVRQRAINAASDLAFD